MKVYIKESLIDFRSLFVFEESKIYNVLKVEDEALVMENFSIISNWQKYCIPVNCQTCKNTCFKDSDCIKNNEFINWEVASVEVVS